MSTASLRARYLGDTVTTAPPQRLRVMLYDRWGPAPPPPRHLPATAPTPPPQRRLVMLYYRLALDLERAGTALAAGDRRAAGRDAPPAPGSGEELGRRLGAG